ncbi:MAG: hypothetical protein GY842_18625 [bacterium]|nr:hypothetical protein [bacterium]
MGDSEAITRFPGLERRFYVELRESGLRRLRWAVVEPCSSRLQARYLFDRCGYWKRG